MIGFDWDVNRWHQNPDPALRNSGDTVNKHQRRVQALCHSLAARIGHVLDGSDLLFAARYHDEAEKVLGDMPAPAKARFTALAAAYAKAELQVLNQFGLNWNLSRIEADMLDLCDKLDAYTWARRYTDVTTEEWHEARAKLDRTALKIGPKAYAWLQDEIAAFPGQPMTICQFAG